MLQGFEHKPRTSSGAFTGGGNKLMFHTTEGSSIAGAIAALDRNRSWSHFLISYEEKRKIQFLEVNQGGRSVSNNNADGYQTNRANVVQIEIVGFAKETQGWSKAKLDWIAEVCGEIRKAFNFPLNTIGDERLSDKAFVDYAGICGHKNCPDNNHTDPGNLDVNYIASKIGGAIKPPSIGGIIVNKLLAFRGDLKLDADGNGYTDVWHSEGKDPLVAIPTINGNNPAKEGYPKIGDPALLVSFYDGNKIKVTCVGGIPKTGFGFQLLVGW